ncbi:DUF1266 domain-containing protein [Streptomyces griseocarneus]|uniref:DUF1266 domain-containing protein n=1 Tax=Streptomyces griseocarneus TaxID=51201 RepID=UPI00167F00D9|nr:DUF1266 domain-containing protein [Streptomyces griseocarneus]MBZ6477959.1 DUF1266 domain-containing protein [Streptomyces griseocarneus]GHG54494.1 hypothetical protein GCM10018779_17520 [Streptomyces griseocarneus]
MQTASADEAHDEFFPVVPAPDNGSLWQAPTDLEQYLYRLSRAGRAYGYLRTLAVEGVYYPVRLDEAQAADEDERPMLTLPLPDGRTAVQVYTSGLLPRPHPHLVYEYASLGALAGILPDGVDVLAVNAATPCEEYFSADDDERETWLDLHHELFEPDGLGDRVVARRTGAPPQGPLLHGLACGAHLCFQNGDAWNTPHWHGMGYRGEVERIADSWGVHGREDWLAMQERLLERDVSPWYWDFVLGARAALARVPGTRVDPGQWRDLVASELRARAREGGAATDDPEFTGFVEQLCALVGEVLRYEARFRADGLLPPDGFVRTVAAWDIGRASKMARWGRGARYATESEMYTALERASRAARDAYGSWEEFSAGYVLGRCLHFDEEHFGSWYTEVLQAHRALAEDPESPWRTVPFATA